MIDFKQNGWILLELNWILLNSVPIYCMYLTLIVLRIHTLFLLTLYEGQRNKNSANNAPYTYAIMTGHTLRKYTRNQ